MENRPSTRPVPIIDNESSFSLKKKLRSTKKESPAPMSPGPPVSRVFQNRKKSLGALAVSFRDSFNIQSPLYTNFSKPYFEQLFTRLSYLGCGSFGEVVKVQSKDDGKLYAIKKSRRRFRSDFDRTQQLEEVNKNEQIKGHPNCVGFYKAWEEYDHLYIQTELCEMSLKDYAESVQCIGEKEIWNIIGDLCKGLKHLHDAQLVHMDIKPANLFLGRDGLYKIGDFGLVVELTRDLSDVMDGDCKYLAPELMEGNVTKAADIFSLGIAILELACSLELPKGGPLWHQLRNDKLPLEFSQGLSDDLIILISNMMERDPGCRPSVGVILNKPSLKQAYRKSNKDSRFSTCTTQIFFERIFSVGKRTSVETNRNAVSANSNETSFEHTQVSDLGPKSHYSPVVIKNKDGEMISPVAKRRDCYRSERDNCSTPDIPSSKRRSFCSTPRHDDVSCQSPALSPFLDMNPRSRLFDTSKDEDVFNPQSLSMNLMKAFEESEYGD